jgi:hypothetical protein
MAVVICEVDTEEKPLSVKIDGKEVGEVSDFSAYKFSDSKNVNVSIRDPLKLDNGMTQITQYYSDSSEIGSALASIADKKTIPGFYGVSPIQNDLRKYLKH